MVSAFPAGFNGIDPDLMEQLIRNLRYRRGDIATFAATHRPRLARLQVDTGSFAGLDRVGAWIDGQLPMLEERKRLAIALDDTAEPGLVSVPDSAFLPPSAAQRQGGALASQFERARRGDYTRLLRHLADHQNDAQYTAAFFSGLGPELTRRLPSLINKYGESGKVGYLIGATSTAFGSAVSGGQNVPGFSSVIAPMSRPLPREDRDGVAALVSAGRFPPEWLATLARGHALNPMYDKAKTETGLSRPDIDVTDRDAYRLFLRALGNNPEASRLAFRGIAEDKAPRDLVPNPPDMPETLAVFTRLAQLDPKVAEQLGRAYAAASGGYDEGDGRHSKDAGRFAFQVMTTMPDVKGGVPEAMRHAMAEIAGAYPTEITEGAYIDDKRANQRTAFGDVGSATPGLNPIFGLSPRDTYRFLKTFADSDHHEQPFERGMGELTRRLISTGVHTEQLIQAGKLPSGTPGLERVMTSLGFVSGLQTQAETAVRGRLDSQDAKARELAKKTVSLGIDYGSIFLPEVGIPAALVWETLKQLNSTVMDSAEKGDGNTRLAQLDKGETQATLASQYSMTRMLMQAHYTMPVRPEEIANPKNAQKYQVNYPGLKFTDANGNLLPFEQIRSNPKLYDNYRAWLEANGLGGNDNAFGQVAAARASTLIGTRGRAKKAATEW